MIAVGLLLTLGIMSLGTAVGSLEALFNRLPWTVLTVGVAATTLVAAFLMVWFRTDERG